MPDKYQSRLLATGRAPRSGVGAVNGDTAEFELARSFAYRLAVLADRVSLAVARVYEDRFGLSRAEWRVIAALAANERMTAKELGPYSTLDKMQVSRAVQLLEASGYIERQEDESDRRSKILRLTPGGQALYRQIRPLVVAQENYILGMLKPQERAALDDVVDRLRERAIDLIEAE
jgi:DNA-binding MarR family transcriptional regulator